MRFDITSLIAIPLPSSPYPYPALPIELVRSILELAASEDQRTSLSFLLVSKPVRRWVHPVTYGTVEIFGLQRMVDFATIFSNDTLLASSVRNLTLYDDTPGDFVSPALALDTTFLPKILALCKGVRRLAVNYIRKIPTVDGPRPYELTVRRGLRNVRLDTAPFDGVTHLHCRFEQLMQSFTVKRLVPTRLTHLCFTHHLDFPDASCQETVAQLLQAPQIQVLIVEVAYQKWHGFEDPSVRRALADNPDERLFVRMSKYDTVRPYDRQRVFPRDGAYEDVWDVSMVRDWRTRSWENEAISQVYNLVQDRTLPGIIA